MVLALAAVDRKPLAELSRFGVSLKSEPPGQLPCDDNLGRAGNIERWQEGDAVAGAHQLAGLGVPASGVPSGATRKPDEVTNT